MFSVASTVFPKLFTNLNIVVELGFSLLGCTQGNILDAEAKIYLPNNFLE